MPVGSYVLVPNDEMGCVLCGVDPSDVVWSGGRRWVWGMSLVFGYCLLSACWSRACVDGSSLCSIGL